MDVEDPVSSLRAAALLTRNVKRRGVSNSTEIPSFKRTKVNLPVTTAEYNHNSGSADKEEGEISEDEAHLSLQDARSPSPSSQSSLPSPTPSATLPEPSPPMWHSMTPARPHLHMTDEQLWEAKIVVLDLLGWGVPPSYLIEFGLSREALYYVFTELQLQLPDNFYIGNMVEQVYNDTDSTFDRKPHDRVPSPIAIQEMQPESRHEQSRSPLPTVDSSQSQPRSQPLLEMEQMRRKELLARKAVMASRRQKMLTKKDALFSSASNSSAVSEEIGCNGQVETFLQTIAPVEQPRSSESSTQQEVPQQSIATNGTEQSSGEPLSANQHDFNIPGRQKGGTSRSGKRPVAADFVDVFDNEQLAESKTIGVALPTDFLGEDSMSGRSTPNTTQIASTARSREPDFNKVSVIRKCVIDFSDNEDDTPAAERILSDIALVKAKEEEIRRLRERIERYKGKQRAEIEVISTELPAQPEAKSSKARIRVNMTEDDVESKQAGGQLDLLSDSEIEMENMDQDEQDEDDFIEQLPNSRFETYSSLFDSYTRLKPARLTAESELSTAVSDDFLEGSDPLQRVCKYEVPGGGTCKDAGCIDFHLERSRFRQGPGKQGVS